MDALLERDIQLNQQLAEGVYQLATPRVFVPLLQRGPEIRYKGAHGGRGSGKSWFFAGMLIERLIYEPNLLCVCVREIQLTLKQSVKRLLENTIRAMGVEHLFKITEEKIERRGYLGTIIFQGMQNHNSVSIKSLEGFDIAWVEEAQSLSVNSLNLLRPTIRKDGSEIWFSWNPLSKKDAVEELLRGKDRVPFPEAIVVEANWMHNPYFPTVLRAEMERDRTRDIDKYLHVWMGKYRTQSQARVFKNVTLGEFDTPKNVRFRFGCDWGFSNDPTVLLRSFLIERTLYIDREAWKVGLELDHTPALFAGDDVMRQVDRAGKVTTVKRPNPRWHNPLGFKGIEGATRWPIIADSANPQAISYMQRRGFDNLRPSVKGIGSVEEGIIFLQSYDIVINAIECPHAAEEFTTYSWKVDPKTEEVLPVLEDAKNHTIDSGRYSLEPERHADEAASFGRY